MCKRSKSISRSKHGNNHGARPPRWSNGTLLGSRTNALEPRTKEPEVGKWISEQLSHGRRRRVLVLTKREAARVCKGTHSSRFERTRDSGKGSDFVAAVRVHGRTVFLDRNSAKPTESNRVYEFDLVGENPNATVYFARVILPEETAKPTSISIDVRTGKIVANNGRMPKLSMFKSKKPHNRPNFNIRDEEDDDRFDRDFLWSDFAGDEIDEDCQGKNDNDAAGAFWDEIAEKQAMRPLNATWCHNCGCRICECDGTSQVDAQPYLMPAHLTDVRFPKRTRYA